MFGESLPTFNVKGNTEVSTTTGGILTVLIVIVLLIYGAIKFDMLMDKYNPEISEVTEKEIYDEDEIVNLT